MVLDLNPILVQYKIFSYHFSQMLSFLFFRIAYTQTFINNRVINELQVNWCCCEELQLAVFFWQSTAATAAAGSDQTVAS